MMLPLDKALRNQLERTIKHARNIAEDAARAVLEQLGVSEATPFAHLSETERELRRKLRLHGRQLGDSLNGGSIQSMERLVEETAYQHWHRMLFARFLAENNLLMYPDPDGPVAVSLEECEELAADEGAANGWELAARYAADMLPQIFRLESPVFQLMFSPEHQLKLERLLADLAEEVFTASDSLGWVYQFWQADNKERINKSEVKIGARELPAVTQLFTEPYMVSFLLDNSLGAWWAARRLTADDLKNATSEQELRDKAAIPGVSLDYLRFVQVECLAGNKIWTLAAGTFDSWPDDLANLKTLDPCCGSGHFLVATLLMLIPMRIERDGLSTQGAVDAVLHENIHGLEIDQRCVELAAFALALTAWSYPGSGGFRTLPELNVACSGLSISAKKEDWLALAETNTNLEIILEELYEQFKDAPVLGSLINPKASLGANSLFETDWDDIGPLLTKALKVEGKGERSEVGITAYGVAKTASLMSQSYSLVLTNYPFVGTRKQDVVLREYCEEKHPKAKHDLSTCFIDRTMSLLCEGGSLSFVSPHNWLFLSAYKDFRIGLLKEKQWNFVATLGARSFQTPMYDFSIALTIMTNSVTDDSACVRGISVENYLTPDKKSAALQTDEILVTKQTAQLSNPDQRIVLTESSNFPLLEESALCLTGAMNGDSPKFLKQYWEFNVWPDTWVALQSTVTTNVFFGGREQLILFDLENGHLREDAVIRRERLHSSDERGKAVWNKVGVMVHRMGKLPVTIYRGDVYDQNGAAIVPKNNHELSAFWCFLSSELFNNEVRRLDNKVGVTPATLAKIPFDSQRWMKAAKDRYPKGLPNPYSNDPTQWLFHGYPCGSVVWDEDNKWTIHGAKRVDDSVLQIAVARLLGYRWPAELDVEMELADEQRDWVKRCDALLSYADDDGIVCIPPVRGEATAASRLLDLLVASYNEAWSNDILAQLLSSASHAGKSLESWLRDKFFAQHCKLFENRPFIWHIWDGLPDGFAALVNYHNLDYKTLETLIYTYLGDWISRQKQDIASGVDGAEEKLAAAEALKKKLELILQGEAPYDIFVRWKSLEEQPIGWHPDLNDGVRLNIRPFMSVSDVAKKGAGVLRDKPNIHWKKDRGSDVASAPWYHLGLEYDGKEGDRINDHHLGLAEKIAARES